MWCCKDCCPANAGKALMYSVFVWLVGLAWGTYVFMTPALKDWPTMPFISQYPAISLPLLIFGTALVYFLSKDYLKDAREKMEEGKRLGATMVLTSVYLDALAYYAFFKNPEFFFNASVWLSYALLLTVPWYVGKKMEGKPAERKKSVERKKRH